MQSNAKSTAFKLFLALVLIGGAGAGAYTWYRRPKQAPVEYKTSPVSRGDVVQVVTANGSLTPVRNVEVGSQISGTLIDVKVDFNDRVKAGDVIARIDPATYERGLLQAEAELANARSAHQLARLNFNRGKDLFTNKLISQSEYDQLEAGLSQADSVVKMRDANVERAKVDLSRTTIYAPIDGMVINRKIEIGQTVAASLNTPTLFVLANDLAKMRIEAAVSEADVGGVTEGQTVNFTVDAFPRRQFKGVVKQVRFAPTTNQNVITYTTIVEVDNQDLKLRPGMTANASIVISERKGALRIPNAALRFRPPEGATVEGATNALAAAAGASTNAPPEIKLATSGPFAGLPEPPWSAERRRPSQGEREQWLASLPANQKEKVEKVFDEMRSRFAQGGGPGGGGGGFGGGGGGGGFGDGERQRRSEPDGPRTQVLYLVQTNKTLTGTESIVLKPATVKLGISDGATTEVLEGLKEGDVIATGAITQVAAAPAVGGSPFGGSPFGGPPRGR